MSADEAIQQADEFLNVYDPEGDYDPRQTRLIAMAILYGEKRGLTEGRDLAIQSVNEVFGA